VYENCLSVLSVTCVTDSILCLCVNQFSYYLFYYLFYYSFYRKSGDDSYPSPSSQSQEYSVAYASSRVPPLNSSREDNTESGNEYYQFTDLPPRHPPTSPGRNGGDGGNFYLTDNNILVNSNGNGEERSDDYYLADSNILVNSNGNSEERSDDYYLADNIAPPAFPKEETDDEYCLAGPIDSEDYSLAGPLPDELYANSAASSRYTHLISRMPASGFLKAPVILLYLFRQSFHIGNHLRLQ